jgi:spore coat protein CotF
MNDQELMENMLQLEKGVCDLYLHGSIESATPEVRQCFRTALNESLNRQGRIYDEMSARGWYQPDAAEQQKCSQVRTKFSAA